MAELDFSALAPDQGQGVSFDALTPDAGAVSFDDLQPGQQTSRGLPMAQQDEGGWRAQALNPVIQPDGNTRGAVSLTPGGPTQQISMAPGHEAEQPSVQSVWQARLNALPRGAIQATGQAISGAAEALTGPTTQERLQRRLDVLDAADAGKVLTAKDDPEQLQQLQPDERAALRQTLQTALKAGYEPPGERAAQAVAGAGQTVADVGSEQFPVARENERDLGVMVSGGLGSFVPMLAAAASGGPVALGAAAVTAGAQAYDATYKRAMQENPSRPDLAHQAATLSGLVGAGAMTVPVARFYSAAQALTGAPLSQAAVRMAAEGGVLTALDQGQKFADNIIAGQTYAPDRSPLEGMGDPREMAATGLTGALLPGILHAPAAARRGYDAATALREPVAAPELRQGAEGIREAAGQLQAAPVSFDDLKPEPQGSPPEPVQAAPPPVATPEPTPAQTPAAEPEQARSEAGRDLTGIGKQYHAGSLDPRIEEHVRAEAQKRGVDPDWAVALFRAEGGGFDKVSSAGAMGPAQLMPGTARELGVDPHDWKQNVAGGVEYFKRQLDRFGGDYGAATAAYNAGPGNRGVERFAETGEHEALPAETKNYVATIAALAREPGRTGRAVPDAGGATRPAEPGQPEQPDNRLETLAAIELASHEAEKQPAPVLEQAASARDPGTTQRDQAAAARSVARAPDAGTIPPEAAEARTRIADGAQAMMRFVGLSPEIGLKLADRIVDAAGHAADGSYTPDHKLIELALDSGMKPEELPQKLFHETVHAIMDPRLGILSEGQRNTLYTAAESWMRRQKIKDDLAKLYGTDPQTLRDEAVARMGEAAFVSGTTAQTAAGRVYDRLLNAIRGFGQVLRGNGYTTADDVFRGVLQGDRALPGSREALMAAGPRDPVRGVFAHAGIPTAALESDTTRETKAPEQPNAAQSPYTDPTARSIQEQGAAPDRYMAIRAPETPEFKRWFGESKVVDREGKPLVLYHGTKGNIERFAPEHLGTATTAPSAREAFFFTNKPHVADTYAERAPNIAMRVEHDLLHKREEELNSKYDALFEKSFEKQALLDAGKVSRADFIRWWDEHYKKPSEAIRAEIERNRARMLDLRYNEDQIGGNVVPTFLKMANPLVKDYAGKEYRDESFNDLIQHAKAAGHDGVVFKDVYDAWKNWGGDDYRSDVYAVFKPEQIKSAISNRGTFDPADPRINYSKRDEAPRLSDKAGLERAGQAVLPGAERDERGALQRRADAPLAPTAGQKPADDLPLFDRMKRDQPSLFAIRYPSARDAEPLEHGTDTTGSDADRVGNGPEGRAGAEHSLGNVDVPVRRDAPLAPGTAAGRVVPGVNESIVDRLHRDTEPATNLGKGRAGSAHDSGLPDIPPSVQSLVRAMVNDHQVLRAVVASLPVDVMNVLRSEKLSPEHLLSNKAVLEGVLRGSLDDHIALPGDVPLSTALMRAIARAGAESSAFAGWSAKANAAEAARPVLPVTGSGHGLDYTSQSPVYNEHYDPSKYSLRQNLVTAVRDGTAEPRRRMSAMLSQALFPMRSGSKEAQTAAFRFAQALRGIQWRYGQIDRQLRNTFSAEERSAMGSALDAQSVFEQRVRAGEATETDRAAFDAGKTGLAGLSDKQRQSVDALSQLAEQTWQRLADRKLVKPGAEGLPNYMPRQFVMMDGLTGARRIAPEDNQFGGKGKGEGGGLTSMDQKGRNLTTAGPKAREYLTPEESESAAKAKFGDNVALVTDIRSLVDAIQRQERAVAGRDLVDSIKRLGAESGIDLVREGVKPDRGYFTLDHPALWTVGPTGETNAEGKPIYGRVPLHIDEQFRGPLDAVLSQPAPDWYRALQTIKGQSMKAIMFSPYMHRFVEYGRSFPIFKGNPLAMWRASSRGETLGGDRAFMDQAIKDGVAPIASGFKGMDAASIMNDAIGQESRFAVMRALQKVDETAARGVGKVLGKGAEETYLNPHEKLLWDKVRNLQVGIYAEMRDRYIEKGFAPRAAGIMAAHLANRYAGALPQEHLSRFANMAANLGLFSRAFTIGNAAIFKDMLNGMPGHLRATIETELGKETADKAQSALRRKAVGAFVFDIGMMYGAYALAQTGFSLLRNSQTMGLPAAAQQEWQNYLDGMQAGILPQSRNEPGKEDRAYVGQDSAGRGIYTRVAAGKVAEDLLGWVMKPGTMLLNKLNPLVRATWESVVGQDSLGRQIYRPHAQGMLQHIEVARDIALHIGASLMPSDFIQQTYDLLRGQENGDKGVAAARILAPLSGLGSISSGNPKGPVGGFEQADQQQRKWDTNKAYGEAKQLFNQGREDDARRVLWDAYGTDGRGAASAWRSIVAPGRAQVRLDRRFQRTASDDAKARAASVTGGRAAP